MKAASTQYFTVKVKDGIAQLSQFGAIARSKMSTRGLLIQAINKRLELRNRRTTKLMNALDR